MSLKSHHETVSVSARKTESGSTAAPEVQCFAVVKLPGPESEQDKESHFSLFWALLSPHRASCRQHPGGS